MAGHPLGEAGLGWAGLGWSGLQGPDAPGAPRLSLALALYCPGL